MNKIIHDDEYYMKIALKEAQKAYDLNEVPVGCVIVHHDRIIARAHNKRYQEKSVFKHAEMIAIQKAAKKLGNWMLDECTIYITLEPCLMCAGTIIQSRIKRVVFAASEPKFGAFGSIADFELFPINYKIEVVKGIKKEEASQMLKSFFRNLRMKKLVP